MTCVKLRSMSKHPAIQRPRRPESGQALVIIAAAFIGMLAFIGLAVDTGILIIAQAALRRAVDSAALAAASQVREGQDLLAIGRFAGQFVKLNGLSDSTVVVQMCNGPGTALDEYRGATDSVVRDVPMEAGDVLCAPPRRKQIRVNAESPVRFTFLTLVGWTETTVKANATSEAASIDMVIVLDTSMSMGNDDPRLNDPAQAVTVAADCNAERLNNVDDPTGKCRPQWDTKQAAKRLVSSLFVPYDRVAIVTFDFDPNIEFALSGNVGTSDPASGGYAGSAYQAIDNMQIHIDAPAPPLNPLAGQYYNPVDNRCRVGQTATCDDIVANDDYSELSTCSGCGMRLAGSLLKFSGRPEAVWVVVFLSDGTVNMSDLPNGPYQAEFDFSVPTAFPSGFCQGPLGHGGWRYPFCVVGNFTDPSTGATTPFLADPHVRHCGVWADYDSAAKCPPGSLYVGPTGSATIAGTPHYYDVQDYARDQADALALTVNCRFKNEFVNGHTEGCSGQGADMYNENEPMFGSPAAIYSIALGRLAANPPNYAGEVLLRYLAAVGDDGDRATDPCTTTGFSDGPAKPPRTSCGNYYFAPGGDALVAVFEDIARRVFTRLTR